MSKLKFQESVRNVEGVVVRMKSVKSKKEFKRKVPCKSVDGRHGSETKVIDPKQRKSKSKRKAKKKVGVATETETAFRLSQEFSNCNWLERKIKEEKLKREKQASIEDTEDEEAVASLVVDDKEATEKTVPCIAISEDLGNISVEGCDSTTMEDSKSDILNTIKDYNFLLGDLSALNEAKNLEKQLSEEVEALRNEKSQLKSDVEDLRDQSTATQKKIEKLSQEMEQELQSKRDILKEVEDLSHTKPQVTSKQRTPDGSESQMPRNNQSSLYSDNPMPNFNFHYNHFTNPMASHNPISTSSHHHQLAHPIYQHSQQSLYQGAPFLNGFNLSRPHPAPNHFPWPVPLASQAQGQSHFPGYPQAQYPAAPPLFDLCFVCKRQASFVCSACKRAHYCTTTCQKKNWEAHSKVCFRRAPEDN